MRHDKGTSGALKFAPPDARTWSVRVHAGTELLAMATGAGVGDVKASGDFDGSPFTPRTRLVVLARRSRGQASPLRTAVSTTAA